MILRKLAGQRMTMHNFCIKNRLFVDILKRLNGVRCITNIKSLNRSQHVFERNFGNHASQDYHKILGVPLNATKKEIKTAYLQLAKIHHPDANPEDPNSKIRFQEISDAYEALANDKIPPSYQSPHYSSQHKSSSYSNDQREYPKYERGGVGENFWNNEFDSESARKPQFEHFTLPPNVKIRDVLKQILIDLGFENAVKNWDKAISEAKPAFKAACRGDWNTAKVFVQNHILFSTWVILSVAMLIYFPNEAILDVILTIYYYAFLAFVLVFILSFSPSFVILVFKPLHSRFMLTAKKAAKRKQGL